MTVALNPAVRVAGRAVLFALAAGVLVPRFFLYLSLQFPAPTGDGVLFASVSVFHCATGTFETPLYPLDPAGLYRYIWHGIGQPALVSWLNPDCSNAGNFFALAAIIMTTLLIAAWSVRGRAGLAGSLLFALVVAAVQVKQGFRPETLAVLLALGSEILRSRGYRGGWVACASLLAWTHPTAFVIHSVYVALSLNGLDWKDLAVTARTWLLPVVALQLLLVVLYPFPVRDLINGLAAQGAQFADRSDGDLFSYFIRSDFLPLFGLSFILVYVLAVVRKRWLLGLAPLIWFYGFRVPPAYYNILPLYVVLLYGLLVQIHGSLEQQRSRLAINMQGFVTMVAGLLAWIGLLQGDLRDVYSYIRYRGTLDSAVAQYQALRADNRIACEVPPYFTLFLESSSFVPSYVATLKECSDSTPAGRVDLLAATQVGQALPREGCTPWPIDAGDSALGLVFRRDSGYSFHLCPAAVEP